MVELQSVNAPALADRPKVLGVTLYRALGYFGFDLGAPIHWSHAQNTGPFALQVAHYLASVGVGDGNAQLHDWF